MSTLVFSGYSDLAWLVGGTPFDLTPSGFSYVSAWGVTLRVTGSGLVYADGLPSGGRIASVVMGGDVPVMTWTGLSVLATGFALNAFTAPDALKLEQLMLALSDRIEAGDGNGSVHGRAGNDTIYAGAGDDWIFGDGGRDTYFGGEGTDGVSFRTPAAGGHGIKLNLTYATQVRDDGFGNYEAATDVERWEGSDLNDSMVGAAASDTFWGADGDDTLRGGGESDWLYGNAGNDRIYGDAGVDILNGGRGVDYYDGGADGDILQLWIDEGNDTGARIDLRLYGGNILNDGFGNVETAVNIENIEATALADWLHAGDRATAQPVVIHGLAGDDTLIGGRASAVLNGGEGADLIQGGAGAESISGGAGVDTLDGGAGVDMIDLYLTTFGLPNGVRVNLSLATGQIQDDGFGNVETALNFENLSLSDQADVATGNSKANQIHGNGGADWLVGAAGDDFLFGGAGNDTLQGGSGNDWIEGGAGDNRLTGGTGADRFALDAGGGMQSLTDFVSGLDSIILDIDFIDFGGAFALTEAQFAQGLAAVTEETRVIHDQPTGRLWLDADGAGAGGAVLIATLTNHAALTYGDFGITWV
ncbi:hypothetical protein NX862_00280 [Rhodobacter sp. KR11]|uniref:calcium-binding protein n=1 Tax=Rhodobacter sp. KR11 TaxID=2974588 RepID=UPI0022218F31|nr:calcium-binding protein [Rhodobacter sp. KR11]MCW1917182.1 hypothetical protein [Rhodobacter sp. KR11]